METFWTTLYDRVKDRRYGLFFLTALAAFLGLLVLGACIYEIARAESLEDLVRPVLWSIGLILIVLGWWGVRRARQRDLGQLKREALSRDELAKARSKLKREMKPVGPVMIRAPDTDLKY